MQAMNVTRVPALLAVSKRHPAASIRRLYQAGQRHFGESYVQEALEKMAQLHDLDIEWHFIGPIQSNKTRPMAESFDWVQSVDRLKILERLNRQRPGGMAPLKVLLQLKVGDEASKSGATESDIYIMYQAAQSMSNLAIKGLMCIPPASDDYTTQCAHFNQAKRVFEKLQAKDDRFEVLSMGMSGDLEAAAQCGSTMARVGTDIFGARD